MKIKCIAAILFAVLLSACAPLTAVNPNGETLTTGSRLYNAQIAADAGLTQAQTAQCVQEGEDRLWTVRLVPGQGDADASFAEGGKAYERCVLRLSGKTAQR